ncbi:MAG TPA: SlyX family protein [Acidiferrobacterales bacterium]
MTDPTTDTRLVDLEIRLTQQDAALQTLSDALLRQDRLLEALVGEVERLKEQARAGALVGPAAEEPPPPHY